MFYSIKAHQIGIEVKKALSITSKITLWLLVLLGVYALVIFVTLKAYYQNKGYRILTFGVTIMTEETVLILILQIALNNWKKSLKKH
ncbi:hypothetical protein HpDR6_18700 [Helicobacter pylori]